MDFTWNAGQSELRERVERFAREKLKPKSTVSGFDASRFRLCGEFGLLGLCAPVEYGGLALDALSTAAAMEAFGHACEDFGLVFAASAHLLACVTPIAHHGDPALRDRYLPGLCRGELIGANAITEASAGSDVSAMTTRARREGDHFVLNGSKAYVTNGSIAELFIVYAATEPADGIFGISAFAVERGSPGLTVAPAYRKLGLESASLAALQLDDCRVPAWACLGQPGQGREIFGTSMAWERTCLFAAYVGAMTAQLEQAVAYVTQRVQFGRKLSSFQAISHRLVDMKVRLEGARLLLYRACCALDRGAPSGMDVAIAKLAVSEAAVQSALDAIRVHGGVGTLSEHNVAKGLWDAVPSLTFSGTSEIQKELIAREMGL